MLGADNRERSSRRRLLGWLTPSEFEPESHEAGTPRPGGPFEVLAVVAMVGSFGLAASELVHRLSGGPQSYLLFPLAVAVAAEAMWYWWRFARVSFQPREWLVLLSLPVLAAKLTPYAFLGLDRLGTDVWRWWRAPLELFDPAFLFSCLVIMVVFRLTLDTAQDLSGLRVHPGEIADHSGPASEAWFASRADHPLDHLSPILRLGSRFVWGGVVMVLLSAVAAMSSADLFTVEGVRTLVTFSRPPLTASLAEVIVYFLAGLLLMVKSQWERRRTLWTVEQVPVTPNVGGRWLSMGMGLVVVIAALVLLLPTYSPNLHDILMTGLAGLNYLAMALMVVLYYGLSLLLWPLSLLPAGSPSVSPAEPPQSTESRVQNSPPPNLDVLGAVVFWVIALAIVAYVLHTVWLHRGRPGRISFERISWRSLWRFFANLTRLFWRAGHAIGQTLTAGLIGLVRGQVARLEQPKLSHRPFRSMGPRELIEYFYASMVEHAARAGHPRRLDETPSEYAVTLRERLPELDPELRDLTDAFMWARYSPHPVGQRESSWARRCWESVRQRLKLRSRPRHESRQ